MRYVGGGMRGGVCFVFASVRDKTLNEVRFSFR